MSICHRSVVQNKTGRERFKERRVMKMVSRSSETLNLEEGILTLFDSINCIHMLPFLKKH